MIKNYVMPVKDKEKKVVYHEGTDKLLKDVKELLKLPLRRGMEIFSRASPGGTPRDAAYEYFHTPFVLPNLWNDTGYVFTGVGKSSQQNYNGLFGRHREDKIKPDMIDATIYGKEVNPVIGRQLDNSSGDYGIYTEYMKDNHPGVKAQYIETEPHGVNIPNQDNIRSLGNYNGDLEKGEFRISLENTAINNAGIMAELGERNDSLFVRGWDVWDFEQPGDSKQGYIQKYNDGAKGVTRKLLDIYAKNAHPTVIRTPWVHHFDAADVLWNNIAEPQALKLWQQYPNYHKYGSFLNKHKNIDRKKMLNIVKNVREMKIKKA